MFLDVAFEVVGTVIWCVGSLVLGASGSSVATVSVVTVGFRSSFPGFE